ncbi:hypothetical protein ACJMK2_021628 [Sinanodonta woodiana]|uniref:Uncharacterized protein n=1 Tax=Sinanodonta woodiana TaxID=1069815 RepID=A0ABD3THV8_SINWO
MSITMLSDMRSDRALGLLQIGELAWIDGKEYSFCYAKNSSETSKTCKYVTVMREDISNKHTYICNKGKDYTSSDEFLSYTDAANTCQKSHASLQVVETFVLPLIVPVNKTYWIKGYNATSIINRLSANENVTEICIGIVKLDHDIFELSTASCDANHTVICDTNLIFLVLYSTVWVMPFAIILVIAIVKVRKKRFAKGIVNNSVYQKRRSDAKRKHDRETLPQNYCMRWNNTSESKSLPCHNKKIKGEGNDLRDASDDEGYDNFDPQLDLYENPIITKKSTSRYHIQGPAVLAKQAALSKDAKSSENEKDLLTDRISLGTQKYMSMHANERDREVVDDTGKETLYENFGQVDMSLECHYDNI